MSETDGDPSGAEVERGQSLLAEISREMVKAMKTFYGKGPVKAKSYLVDDLLFVVLRGGFSVAEGTMLEAGHQDVVREFRQRFGNEMAQRLRGTIEQLTDRQVVNYQSQVLFDPDALIQIFIFDQPLAKEAQAETAAGLLHPDSALGEVTGDEVEQRAAD